jgi:hypothetical protein
MQNIAAELRNIIEHTFPKLQQIVEEESGKPIGKEKWSRKQLLGHLIDSAANNHQRFVRAQLSSHINLSGYQQNDWVRVNNYQRESWSELVQLWKSFNLHLAHVVQFIPNEALHNTISLDEKPPMTLRFVIEDYIRHLRHHLEQMFETISR